MSTLSFLCTRCDHAVERVHIEHHPPTGGWRLTAFCHGEREEFVLEKRHPLMRHPLTAGGPPCADCGGATQRAGTCFVCQTCGTTTGCG